MWIRLAVLSVVVGCAVEPPTEARTSSPLYEQAMSIAKSMPARATGELVEVGCDSDGGNCIITCGDGGPCERVGTETGDIWICGC